MKNKKTVLWYALMVLALGMTVVGFNGCSKNVDRSLNGTWESEMFQWKFDSGNFENSKKDGTPLCQGTYTTKDGEITIYIEFCFANDSRWYSKNELNEFNEKNVTNGIVGFYLSSDDIAPYSLKYTVNGKILTTTSDNGYTESNTLVSPNGKFTKAKAAGNSKESVPAKKSSRSVSSFTGRWHLIEVDGNSVQTEKSGVSVSLFMHGHLAEDVELFKDGTGTADGSGITWKIENGRFHILHPFYTFSAYYNVKGSTVTFTTDDGGVIKYQKK